MQEKRRSQRIDHLTTGWLHHNGGKSRCRIENISKHGAMVSLRGAPVIPIQNRDECLLNLYHEEGGAPYANFKAQVTRIDTQSAGLEFTELNNGLEEILEKIIVKEQCLLYGAEQIITHAGEVAHFLEIELSDIFFDRGALIPERDVHTLRLFAGEHTSRVHLFRSDMEKFHVQTCTGPVHNKIFTALGRLHGELRRHRKP